jgi:hypothetical protein
MKWGRLQLFYYAKQLVKYAPAPLFLMGFAVSIINPNLNSIVCGSSNSMSLMWLLMSVAHTGPYLVLWEIKGCPRGCGSHRS